MRNREQIDFRVMQMRETRLDGTFSHYYEKIELTIDCLKSLGMMAGSDQGKAIRKYFLECERMVRQKQQVPMTGEEVLEKFPD